MRILGNQCDIHKLYICMDNNLSNQQSELFVQSYIMQSYSYESVEEEDAKQQYKQQLGLRKMLYKYQHENQQLKNQIRALTERLQSILSEKPREQLGQIEKQSKSPAKMQDAHTKYLNQQMNYFFKRIEQLNGEINNYKDSIDSSKQLQFTNLTNTLKDKTLKLQNLKSKLQKYKSDTAAHQISAVGLTVNMGNQQLQIKYTNELVEIKKKIRQLQKVRNSNHKNDISRHMEMMQLQTKTRKINKGQLFKEQLVVEETSGPGKKGLWGMDLTEENYKRISQDLQQLKKEKGNLIESIRIQNDGLRDRLKRLKSQYIDISSQNVNYSMDISAKRLKESVLSTPKQKLKDTIILPDIPVPLGNSAYERKNDKNFIPKKIKLIEWNPNKSKKANPGFAWNDENKKSPITGINLWMEKFLIGIQFIHTLGQTSQHIHTEGGQVKKTVPIQYRLNSDDYLQNIVAVYKSGKEGGIQGIELQSKKGRKDAFGVKAGSPGTQKFDFGICSPEKPIYSFGSLTINPTTHLSSIHSLGFAVI